MTVTTYTLSGDLSADEERTIFSSESKISLPNTAGHVTLLSPYENEVSTIEWAKTEEGREYYPVDLRSEDVTGTIIEVLENGTILFTPDAQFQKYLSKDTILLEIIGLEKIEDYSENTFKVVEYIRALLEDQKIDLQFDTELWSKDEKLQSYLSVNSLKDVSKELIGLGLIKANRVSEYQRKDEYLLAEQDAKEKRLGIWKDGQEESLVSEEDSRIVSSVSSASLEKKKVVLQNTAQKTPKKVVVKKVAPKKKSTKKNDYYTQMYNKDLLAAESFSGANLSLIEEASSDEQSPVSALGSFTLSLGAGIFGSFLSRKLWL
jgi:dipeptidyl aminopeptidase/acylaminoacyl peptidase